jgi:hypothetical protein
LREKLLQHGSSLPRKPVAEQQMHNHSQNSSCRAFKSGFVRVCVVAGSAGAYFHNSSAKGCAASAVQPCAVLSISGNQGSAPRGTPAAGLGGAVAVTEKATVQLGGTTTVDGNTAGTSGAGVFSAGNAALIVSPGVKFGSNKVADKSFGYDVAASGASRFKLPPVTVANSNMFST